MAYKNDSNIETWKKHLKSKKLTEVFSAMTQITLQMDPSLIQFLEEAGSEINPSARTIKLTMPDGKFTLEEYRKYCIRSITKHTLSANLKEKPNDKRTPKVFISYNHKDRNYANQLGLELKRHSEIEVFLDHWEMSISDRLLDRITREIENSDFLLCILSPSSVESIWVQQELEYAFLKQEKIGRKFIIPILIEDSKLPDQIIDRFYLDWRDKANRAYVIQNIINHVKGKFSFSERVRTFLLSPDPQNPYNETCQINGRRILLELGKYPELELENNQKFLLWKLFHEILYRYPCTLKILKSRNFGSTNGNGIGFWIIDRWNKTSNFIHLSTEDFQKGLWIGEVDLLSNRNWTAEDLVFVNSQGRLSYRSRYNPNVSNNPAESIDSKKMNIILDELKNIWGIIDTGAKESFLFDFQRLIEPKSWHLAKFVVGQAYCDISLAFSSMVKSKQHSESKNGAIFEIYNNFFSSLKVTQLRIDQLNYTWETDVDFMSSNIEVYLGVA